MFWELSISILAVNYGVLGCPNNRPILALRAWQHTRWVDGGLSRGEARWRSRSADLVPDKVRVPWGACELETVTHYSREQVAAGLGRI